MRSFAVVNQKGGVGKTTTAINLATALSAVEKRILLIDLDPQGNASTGFGVSEEDRKLTSYDLLNGDISLQQSLYKTQIKNLHLIPASVNLSGFELEKAQDDQRAYYLERALTLYKKSRKKKNKPFYDFIFIDCPPSLNLLTVNALSAAHSALVPLQCEFFALEGLSQLLKTLNLVKEKLNPSLELEGIILTMFDQRNNLSHQVEQDVREHFGQKVYKTIIPRNIRASEAPSYGLPLLLYDHKCLGSQAYMKLASEILHNHGHKVAA